MAVCLIFLSVCLSVCLSDIYWAGLPLAVLISKCRVSGMSLGLFVNELGQSDSLTSMCSASISQTVI